MAERFASVSEDELCEKCIIISVVCFYQVHVSLSSPVADHCSAYALSDENEPFFSSPCDHYHGNSCSQCEELKAKISDIQAYVRSGTTG